MLKLVKRPGVAVELKEEKKKSKVKKNCWAVIEPIGILGNNYNKNEIASSCCYKNTVIHHRSEVKEIWQLK